MQRMKGFFKMWHFAAQGQLPYPGTWMEQPYWVMQALEIISDQVATWQAEMAERLRKGTD